MATYKVGQRVRIVKSVAFHPMAVGHEAVVTGIRGDMADAYCVDIINYPPNDPFGYWAHGYQLAPLTDPGADAFLSRLNKLGSEPIHDAPKVTVREGIR